MVASIPVTLTQIPPPVKIAIFLYRSALNTAALTACFVVGFITQFVRAGLDIVLTLVKRFGSIPERDDLTPHVQRETMEPVYEDNAKTFINETQTLERSKFPISPEVLVEKSKQLIRSDFGSSEPELLSEDFQFTFPVVGPLPKTEFVTTFASFHLKKAFPDMASNCFGFEVDPTEPNRVWFLTRPVMTQTGELKFGKLTFKPTGIKVTPVPQLLSFSFDREGRCYKFTGGYSGDRTVGNSGGLGGLFGLLYGIGVKLPFPEGRPWRPSPQWISFYSRMPQYQVDYNNMWE